MDKIIYQKYADKLDEYKYILSEEKERELQQFTFDNGIVNGDLLIKCNGGEIRTSSLIFETFSELYNNCKRVLSLGDPGSDTQSIFALDLSMHTVDTVKNVIHLLYREGKIYELNNVKQIIDFLLLAEMLLLFKGGERSLKLCWKHIKQNIINGDVLEPYILDDCLRMVSNCDTHYTVKLFISLLRKHDAEIEKIFTEHDTNECSCKNGVPCIYMQFSEKHRDIITNYLFPLYATCRYCRRKGIACCNEVEICKYHFYN